MILRNMNSRHSKVTDWGLEHIPIDKRAVILDVGCGGGRTIHKLALVADEGRVFGVDYSPESIAVSSRTNQKEIKSGRVEITAGSVSQLPFASDKFDLVTAIETHFFWPNLPGDVGEVLRVLKPGGTFLLVAEVFKGADTTAARLCEKYASSTGMTLLSVEEHRELLVTAGFDSVQVFDEPGKGWICCTGLKPIR
jgi:ubiquinone/menaquinone biosynthesis C-methylase UbiE